MIPNSGTDLCVEASIYRTTGTELPQPDCKHRSISQMVRTGILHFLGDHGVKTEISAIAKSLPAAHDVHCIMYQDLPAIFPLGQGW